MSASSLRVLVRLPFLAALAPLFASAAPVSPLPLSNDYIAGKDLYGSRAGTARGVVSARYADAPALAVRPLSVAPSTELNGQLAGSEGYRVGPGALPPVFGGYTALVYSMPEPSQFTVRPQFQDGRGERGDFININLYHESSKTLAAGVEYRLVAALLVPAGQAGAAATVPLEKISSVELRTGGQRDGFYSLRVLVHDADGTGFYVSEAVAELNHDTLSLAGVKWAPLRADDLSKPGDYRPAAFRRIDHIGVYADSGQRRLDDALAPYAVIGNFTLHSIGYSLVTP